MTRTRRLLIGGLAVAAVVAGVATATAHRGGWGPGRFADGMMGGPGGHLCKGRAVEMADHLVVRIEHRLGVTDVQKPRLDELKTALRSAATTVAAACPSARTGARSGEADPTERLARLEAGLSARLEAIRAVRPVAERFYAALSDEQKATAARMIGRHFGMSGHGRGHGRWREGRSGQDGREMTPDLPNASPTTQPMDKP